MSSWITPSLVYGVLTGVLLLMCTLLSWTVYVRVWQEFLWMHNLAAIEQLMADGFVAQPLRFSARLCFVKDGQDQTKVCFWVGWQGERNTLNQTSLLSPAVPSSTDRFS